MTSDVHVQDLVVEYPGPAGTTRRALNDISLEISEGESFAIVGESGCGKSTLAKVLVGLVTPTRGTVSIGGHSVDELRHSRNRRRIQMVFQDPGSSLNPRRRIGAMLAELIRRHRLVPPERVAARLDELMEMVGLSPRLLDALPWSLSGGQRQRVAIARALAVEPRVLIADEAVSALDVSAQARVINLLADIRDELGLTLIFISHDLAVVRTVCDRGAVFKDGQLVEVADIETLFTNPAAEYTRRLLEAIPTLE